VPGRVAAAAEQDPALSNANNPVNKLMPKQILANLSRCVGCRSCEIACAVAHSETLSVAGALAEGAQSSVLVVNADGKPVPIQCRHCADAPCVVVCPKAAVTKEEDGVVMPHPELCVACRSCVTVCPFGAVRLAGAEGKTLVKCDLCADRREAGQEPACVEACPTGALLFADVAGDIGEAYVAAEAQSNAGELAEEAAEPAVAEGEGKRKPAPVVCGECGEEFIAPGTVRAVAKKLGKRPAYLAVCPRCRRLLFAEHLAAQGRACEQACG
jgi:carbon-monoxide dehydrogenase iron sulfur subunit